MERDELISFVESEFDMIDKTYSALAGIIENASSTTPDANTTAADAAFVFNIYSGIERVLVNVLLFDELSVQDAPDRHERILEKALELGIVPLELQKPVAALLGLRLFFVNRYLIDLKWDDLTAVTGGLGDTISALRAEVLDYVKTI